MALKRKEVKRGRKAGPANLWAQDELSRKARSEKATYTVSLSEYATFDAEGARYTGSDEVTVPGNFVLVPGRFVNDEETLKEAQPRIGSQVRGGIAQAGQKGEVKFVGLEDDTIPGLTILAMVR